MGEYNCTCGKGWTGAQCGTNIDECAGHSPCLHGGTCSDCIPTTQNPSTSTPYCSLGYTCSCPEGFYGDRCEAQTNHCFSSPCLHGGTCSDCIPTTQNSSTSTPYCSLGYTCSCPEDFYGERCEAGISDCFPSPCLNGGLCTDLVTGSGYNCTCPVGYSGENCEVVVDMCVSSPCQHGSRCMVRDNNFITHIHEPSNNRANLKKCRKGCKLNDNVTFSINL